MVLTLMFKILFLMGIGYLATKVGVLDKSGRHSLSELLVNIILPVSMLASSQDEFSGENLKGIALIGIIALLYYLVVFEGFKIAGKVFRIAHDERVISTLIVAFANTGFVGLPLVKELAGQTGMLYGAIYNVIFDLLYFSYGISLLKSDGKGNSVKAVLANPIIWISILAVVLYIAPFRFPSFLTESLELVSDTMMPISMFIIGSEICGMDIVSILKNKTAYLLSFLRMLLIPAVTFLTMYLLKIDSVVAMVAVMLSAMPSGSLNVIMAEKYNKHPELAAVTVMQNTIIMIVTLPLFLYFLQNLC